MRVRLAAMSLRLRHARQMLEDERLREDRMQVEHAITLLCHDADDERDAAGLGVAPTAPLEVAFRVTFAFDDGSSCRALTSASNFASRRREYASSWPTAPSRSCTCSRSRSSAARHQLGALARDRRRRRGARPGAAMLGHRPPGAPEVRRAAGGDARPRAMLALAEANARAKRPSPRAPRRALRTGGETATALRAPRATRASHGAEQEARSPLHAVAPDGLLAQLRARPRHRGADRTNLTPGANALRFSHARQIARATKFAASRSTRSRCSATTPTTSATRPASASRRPRRSRWRFGW